MAGLKAPITFLFIIAFAWAGPAFASGQKTSSQDKYRRLMELARKGEFRPALDYLESLAKAGGASRRTLGDLVTIYQWAGKNEQALEYFGEIDVATAPDYVLQSMAKVARNLGKSHMAINLYSKIIERFPEKPEGYLGMALTYTDTKSWGLALATLMIIKDQRQDDPDYLTILANVYESKGDTLKAFWTYNHLAAIKPEWKFPKRKRILLLSSLGASGLARELADSEPGVVSETDLAQIKGDWAALQVRYGQLTPLNDTVRFDETDISIKTLEENMESFGKKDGKFYKDQYLRARYDRIIALRDRSKMTDVVAEFENMQREGLKLPVYIWIMAGDAYLYLENPEEARKCYQNALKLDPESFNIHLSMAYVLMELDEFSDARVIIDKLAKDEPPYRINRKGKKPVYGKNYRKLSADFATGLRLAFSDHLSKAQGWFEDMTGKAPYNEDLRQALAYVYLWRGWPRRALDEFEKTAGIRPDFMEARLGKAFSLLDLRRYKESEDLVAGLKNDYPENKRVSKLLRAWNANDDYKLTTSASRGNGNEGQVEPSSKSMVIDSRFSFKPMNFNTRFFIDQYYEEAQIGGQWARYQRQGAGLEYGGGSFSIAGEVYNELSDLADYGFTGSLGFAPNDVLKGGVSYDSFSHNVPLRASLEGIDGWEAGAYASFRHSELIRADVSGNYLEFSDGNLRYSGSATVTWSPIYRSRFKVPVSLNLYASENSRESRPYFNPSRDLSTSATIDFRWLVFRRYTRSFQNNLEINYGSYKQEGFDAGEVGWIRYEHEWNLSDSFSLAYRIVRMVRLYDGAYDRSTYFSTEMSWRF